MVGTVMRASPGGWGLDPFAASGLRSAHPRPMWSTCEVDMRGLSCCRTPVSLDVGHPFHSMSDSRFKEPLHSNASRSPYPLAAPTRLSPGGPDVSDRSGDRSPASFIRPGPDSGPPGVARRLAPPAQAELDRDQAFARGSMPKWRWNVTALQHSAWTLGQLVPYLRMNNRVPPQFTPF